MFSSEKTVKLLIRRTLDQKEQILLVHEKGEVAAGGKPAGWGLPGGGVKSHEGDIFTQITKILPVEVRIPAEGGGVRLMTETEYVSFLKMVTELPCISEPKVLLTAVKEGIEETGFLLKPVRELFREPTRGDHEVILVDCEIIIGRLSKHSTETDDVDWFELENLPQGNLPKGLYKSDAGRIARGMEILRQPEQEQYSEKESVYE